MTHPIDIAEVAAGLTQNIERLARELLPLGRREGDEWVEASRAQGGISAIPSRSRSAGRGAACGGISPPMPRAMHSIWWPT